MATAKLEKGRLLRPYRVDGCARFCLVHESGSRNRRLYLWVYSEKGSKPDALYKVLPETLDRFYPPRYASRKCFSATWLEADPRPLLVGLQWEEISPERWGELALPAVILGPGRPIVEQAPLDEFS